MFLPALAIFGLLLHLAGAIQLMIVLLKVMTVGGFRLLVRMCRNLNDRLRRGRVKPNSSRVERPNYDGMTQRCRGRRAGGAVPEAVTSAVKGVGFGPP
jgi:hypothetical protein